MGAIDSHAHLERTASEDDVKSILDAAWHHGLSGVVAVAASRNPQVYMDTASLAMANDRVWAVGGIHPHNASQHELLWPAVMAMLDSPRVVAVGEFGLDYHYMYSPRDVQLDVMKRQLEVAARRDLPIVLHIREAFQEALNVLDAFARTHRGVVHCFTGTSIEAAAFLERGFHLSIPGVVTFGKAAAPLAEAIRSIPTDRLLVETDAPFLAPVPFRGHRNQPAYVAFVLAELARLKGISPAQMAALTAENTRRVFALGK